MGMTSKPMAPEDMQQIIRFIYNENGAICTEGWVTGMVGRKVVYTFGTTKNK